MKNGQDSALNAMAMPPDEVAIVENVDRRLEEQIGEMQRQEVDVKRVVLGRKLYYLFIRYCIKKKIDAVAELGGKSLAPIVSPEIFKRVNVSVMLIERDVLFEKVGGRRYPIRVDFNSDSPLSVKLVL